ncbi:MAG: flagellar motor switch protein FliG [Proteobacteria bacterium]|nr:flagellar motor switch protein FliG [Pseudomonadota bacterium]
MPDVKSPVSFNDKIVGSGAKKAAAVLLGLGPDVAAELFRQLSENELRQIALGAKELRKGNNMAVPEALSSFVEAMEQVGGEVVAGDDFLREIAAAALGEEIASRVFDGVMPPPPPDEALGPVATADPEALAMVLAREQPQTVALVLSSLTPERAAAVMDNLPPDNLPQIVRRMAVVESVAPEVLREVRTALTSELQALIAEGMRKVDGRSAALAILRRTPAAQQGEVLSSIEGDDPELAAQLRTKLFTFDDLTRLGDRDIQALLKEVESNQLILALKGASPEIKDKFLRNMSSRAAQLLADDMAAMGPVRLSVVEEAMAAIAKSAVDLAEKGRITIVMPTDKML